MRSLAVLAAVILSAAPACAFIGMGIDMYNPSCAYACRTVISMAMIECNSTSTDSTSTMSMSMTTSAAASTMTMSGMKKRHGDDGDEVTPACRATSTPFLTTLAYCIHSKCFPDANPTRAKLEEYWYNQATGDPTVLPRWGYQETYDKINSTPTATYDADAMALNTTMLIDTDSWQTEKQSMEQFEDQERLNSRYVVTIFLVGVGLPILFTAVTYLPYFTALARWLKPRYIYPTLTANHVQPTWRFFHVPTFGQSLFIGLLTVMTIVFTAVEYDPVEPNTWYTSTYFQVLGYVGDRTGSLSMPLLPLTILFAGRNNLLLWMSNWSHSTYLLVHRWTARLCLVQILLHSITELARYVQMNDGSYAEQLPQLYWIWGCVGTVACVVIVIAAQFRKYYYEIFLITHIVLAVFLIVGTWYHLEYLFQLQYGYHYWIYLCCGIWFFDRVIRVGRIMKIGIKKATLTPIGDEVVRIDIPGVRWDAIPGQHAYLYLPATRKWAPWENHPFSVIPTAFLSSPLTQIPSNSVSSGSTSAHDVQTAASTPIIEKTKQDVETPLPVLHSGRSSVGTTSGITLFTRRQKGLTAAFKSSRLSALLDGPYRNSSSRPVLATDRLVLFAGGIGVTGILPFVHAHPNVKIYWSVRSAQSPLVDELQSCIPGHVERSIIIDGRNDLDVALAEEVKAGWGLVGVVVCGPGSMCDQVRNRVAWLGKNYPSTKWELDVEAFLW